MPSPHDCAHCKGGQHVPGPGAAPPVVDCTWSTTREFEFGDTRGRFRPPGGWCPLCLTEEE